MTNDDEAVAAKILSQIRKESDRKNVGVPAAISAGAAALGVAIALTSVAINNAVRISATETLAKSAAITADKVADRVDANYRDHEDKISTIKTRISILEKQP